MSLPPDPEQAARLAEATRRVIDVVRRSAASPETMREAADALLAIARRLEPDAHPGPFMQRELVFTGFPSEIEPPIDFADFFPYSPLVGPRNPIAPPIAFEIRGDRLGGRVPTRRSL